MPIIKNKLALLLSEFLLFAPAAAYSADGPPRLSCPRCNVILISLDTLRADSLGTYGCVRDPSPNLDRLADKGAVFLNAYSQAPNTFPSHMSIFTSQYPWTHKVVTIVKDRLAPETVTLSMLLKEQGYRTVWAAPSDDPNLSLEAGFKRGFDDFIEPHWYPGVAKNTVFEWLIENRERKFFMFLHTYRIHDPYLPERSSVMRFLNPVPTRFMSREDLNTRVWLKDGTKQPCAGFPEALIKALPACTTADMAALPADSKDSLMRSTIFWENFDPLSPADVKYYRTLYDAGVFEADRAVGALYDELAELGLADKTMLVITSDHGEEFMEHGIVTHNQPYVESLHVPLIFVFPGKQVGKRIAPIAQSIDIAPTILETVGVPPLPKAEGRSLLPVLEGKNPGWPEPLAFAGPWRGAYSVRNSSYTYLVKNNCTDSSVVRDTDCVTEEFYDRAADPGELKNIFSVNKEAAAGLAGRLFKKLKAAGKAPEYSWPAGISEVAKKKIRDTGYW